MAAEHENKAAIAVTKEARSGFNEKHLFSGPSLPREGKTNKSTRNGDETK